MVDILQQHEPVLREIAQDVALTDITTDKIKKVLKDMKTALDSQDDGVAIAAPQIGVPLRIFLVSGAVMEALKKAEKDGEDFKGNVKKSTAKDLVFINPVIIKQSKKWKADRVKITTTAISKSDCSIVMALYAQHENIIAFCMGKPGKITRVAAPLLGAEFTYASLNEKHATAPGQLTVDELIDIYDVLR